MPCNGGVFSGSYHSSNGNKEKIINDLKKDLKKSLIMLCSACKVLEKNNIAIPRNITKWWTQHKIDDAKREKKARQRRVKAAKNKEAKQVKTALKKTALSKLDSKEKIALGLK